MSVSSVAVELAQQTLGDLARKRVLVIGAGENGELHRARAARPRRRTVFVANRRYDRAIGLAAALRRHGGRASTSCPPSCAAADIVVTSTGSPHQIVGREELELVMEQRAERPLLLIVDIAVPRDVDPGVREVPGHRRSTTWTTSSARSRANMGVREAEASARRARSSSEEVAALRRAGSAQPRASCPTIAALRERGEEIVKQVLRRERRRAGSRCRSTTASGSG